jgi:hypothetical protein
MTFYLITFVSQVSPDGRPLPHDAVPFRGDQKSVRELPFWDARSLRELQHAYVEDGALTTMRVGEQHSKGRPWEQRGDLTIFAPWLIAINADAKMNHKQPEGPVPYQPRQDPRQ